MHNRIIMNEGYKCDLCSSSKFALKRSLNYRLGIEGTGFNVVRCKKCGLTSLYPPPTEDELARIYSGYAAKKDRVNVEKARLKQIYPNKLEKLVKYAKGKRLLDIGAGLGTFIYAAGNAGFDALGIEYEKEQCEMAHELWNNIELIHGGIEDLYKVIGKFDVINLHHVLEHFKHPGHLIDIIYEILNPNGVGLIEIPQEFFNINDEIRYFLTKKVKPRINPLDHLFFFSIKTLKGYIDKDRFEIIELNQFVDTENRLILSEWYKLPKKFWRIVLQKFNVGVGGFIEVYIRKKVK